MVKVYTLAWVTYYSTASLGEVVLQTPCRMKLLINNKKKYVDEKLCLTIAFFVDVNCLLVALLISFKAGRDVVQKNKINGT